MSTATDQPEAEPWIPDMPWACPAGEMVLPYDAPRDDWLAARRLSVGASEVAAVLNLARWQGADSWSVWAEKTGRIPGKEITRAMARGLIMERAVVDLWIAEDAGFPVQVRRRGLMRSKTVPLLAASLDFLSICPDGRCCIEVKTQADTSEWDGDEVPLEYQIQGQIQLLVTGRDHVHFIAMGHRFGIAHRVMYRDPDLMDLLAARVADWWERYVLTDTPPAPTAASLDTIKRVYGNPAGEGSVELPPDLRQHHVRAAELREQRTAIDIELDKLQAQICAVLGDATTALVDGEPVATWNRTRKIVGATKGFARKHRQLVGPYLTMVEQIDAAGLVADHPELLDDGTLRYQRTFNYT